MIVACHGGADSCRWLWPWRHFLPTAKPELHQGTSFRPSTACSSGKTTDADACQTKLFSPCSSPDGVWKLRKCKQKKLRNSCRLSGPS